jgi:hypothetical protein
MSSPSRTPEQAPGSPIQVFEAPPELRIQVPAPPGWRTAFDRRRAVVAALLTPVTVLLFADAPTPGSLDHPGEWLVVGALGVLAALIWASFVPRRDRAATMAASPCGAMAALYPVLTVMTLGGRPLTLFPTLFGLAILTWGLTQRVTGVGACPS